MLRHRDHSYRYYDRENLNGYGMGYIIEASTVLILVHCPKAWCMCF